MAKKKQKVSLDDIIEGAAKSAKLETPDWRVSHWLPTGLTPLDAVMSWDGLGFPLGRVVSLWGEEHSGKTTLALMICRSAMAQGGSVIWNLGEPGLEEDLAKKRLGLDIDSRSFHVEMPETLEQCLDFIEEVFVKARHSPVPLMVVIDTITQLQADSNMDNTLGETGLQTGLGPRTISEFFKRAAYKKILGSKIGLLVIQQTRWKLDFSRFGPGSRIYAPGGKAIAFNSGIILEARAKKPFGSGPKRDQKPMLGWFHNVKVHKSKYGPNQGMIEYPQYFTTGPDDCEAVVDWLCVNKVLKQSGSMYEYAGKKAYRKVWAKTLRQNPKLAAKFRQLLLQNFHKGLDQR